MNSFLKRNLTSFIPLLLLFTSTAILANAQTNDPWKPDQLMEPQVLVNIINSAKGNSAPVILNIGSDGVIKSAIDIGPASEADGIAELKKQLKSVSKDKMVVIYCGCCPLFKCPNVRPAFKLLAAEGYTNINVLNLKTNLKTDWIDKKYPMDAGE
ncbi:MAG TPA: hypothetical protein VK671_12185 [Mucilaginibacter sp.]|nr:hypothetical protein [Mucilaginibacter sp.]